MDSRDYPAQVICVEVAACLCEPSSQGGFLVKRRSNFVIFFVVLIVFFTIIWNNNTFSTGTMNQLIYHTKFTGKGAGEGLFFSWLVQSIIPSIVIFFSTYVLITRYKFKSGVAIRLWSSNWSVVPVASLVVFAIVNYHVFGYVGSIFQTTNIYERQYVDPKNAGITFAQKRNLIYIYLESMETTYLSTNNGGTNEFSVIPELEEMALENTNFSNTDVLGGWLTLEGTQWTIASMIAQNCGIPVMLKIDDDKYEPGEPFLSGAYSLGQVLEANGYANVLLKGSDCDFAGTSNFFDCHGDYNIYDYDVAIEEGFIPDDYKVFWGMEDSKTYEYAKGILGDLSAQGQPFNFTMETVNTHTPDGYLEENVATRYADQYSNVIADASVQVADFINYLKTQDYYDDTTIIVVGDHLSMFDEYFDGIDKDYLRTPFNLIINSAVTTDNTTNRLFSAMDMFPTTIASIGGLIEGDRLGLGTNLYSDQPTLLEVYGFDYLNKELQKSSYFYRSNFIGAD